MNFEMNFFSSSFFSWKLKNKTFSEQAFSLVDNLPQWTMSSLYHQYAQAIYDLIQRALENANDYEKHLRFSDTLALDGLQDLANDVIQTSSRQACLDAWDDLYEEIEEKYKWFKRMVNDAMSLEQDLELEMGNYYYFFICNALYRYIKNAQDDLDANCSWEDLEDSETANDKPANANEDSAAKNDDKETQEVIEIQDNEDEESANEDSPVAPDVTPLRVASCYEKGLFEEERPDFYDSDEEDKSGKADDVTEAPKEDQSGKSDDVTEAPKEEQSGNVADVIEAPKDVDDDPLSRCPVIRIRDLADRGIEELLLVPESKKRAVFFYSIDN